MEVKKNCYKIKNIKLGLVVLLGLVMPKLFNPSRGLPPPQPNLLFTSLA